MSAAFSAKDDPRGEALDVTNEAVADMSETTSRGVAAKPRLVPADRGLFAHGLEKSYGGRPVVKGVSLALQRGEIVGLLGPNGAGKTTCFYMITGLVAPDRGSIVIDGQDITTLPMYRRARLGIGYLAQEPSVFRGLSVENNLRAVLEAVAPRNSQREAIVEALLDEFGLEQVRHNSAVSLSGGERRRVEIARALACNPQFIFLDEPFAGIDPIALNDIRSLVCHLKDRGIGVLITDHNVRETLDVIDHAYIIHDGAVMIKGSPAEIVENEDVRRVYLGDRFSL
jgi:lipopolysaccharide export system ATP-binding protein